MNEVLGIQPDRRCSKTTDGEHTGHWEPCQPAWEAYVLVHTSRFTCYQCGYRMIVVAAGLMPGDVIPEALRQ